MDGFYGLGALVTGTSLLTRGIPWLIADWKRSPPEPPEDWQEGTLLVLSGFWLGVFAVMVASLAWPITWVGVVRRRVLARDLRQKMETEDAQFLLEQIRFHRERSAYALPISSAKREPNRGALSVQGQGELHSTRLTVPVSVVIPTLRWGEGASPGRLA